MEARRDRGQGIAAPDLRDDAAAAKQTDQSEGYNDPADGGIRWVRLRDLNTFAEVVVNLDHIARVVSAPDSDFVQVVLTDSSFVDISATGSDHRQLLAAIGEMEDVWGGDEQ